MSIGGVSDFGGDFGLIHKAVVTGLNAGWGEEQWAKLAHDEKLMRSIASVLDGKASILPNVPAETKRTRWVKPADTQLIRYSRRKNLIHVNLDFSLTLPFADAQVLKNPKGGWVTVELRKKGELYISGAKTILHLEEGQKDGKTMQGDDLCKALAVKAVVHSNVLDALMQNQHLIPPHLKKEEDGQTRFIFFWGVEFSDAGGDRYVRYLYWHDDAWQVGYDWLRSQCDARGPALLRAP